MLDSAYFMCFLVQQCNSAVKIVISHIWFFRANVRFFPKDFLQWLVKIGLIPLQAQQFWKNAWGGISDVHDYLFAIEINFSALVLRDCFYSQEFEGSDEIDLELNTDPFFRKFERMDEKKKGTATGLYFVKELVEKEVGSILKAKKE